MVRTAPLIAAGVLLALLPLTACKIVKNAQPGEVSASSSSVATPQGDAARMSALADEIWTPKVVPFLQEHATDIGVLRTALQAGPDAAGATYGFRPDSEGSPWNFIASGKGKVVSADLASRAAKLDLDTDGDGAADVTVQLGPVMKGTSLRDALSFLVFTDFRDQIEFAKLARALNDKAHDAAALPAGDPVGQTATFTGAFTIRAKGEAVLLTPSELALEAAP